MRWVGVEALDKHRSPGQCLLENLQAFPRIPLPRPVRPLWSPKLPDQAAQLDPPRTQWGGKPPTKLLQRLAYRLDHGLKRWAQSQTALV